MKRRTAYLTISLLIWAALCCTAAGQARITTKKYKLGDFSTKTTRIVLTGNALTDEVMKEEISRRWRISPYEFCTTAEYEETKGSTLYYFLIPMQERFRDGGTGLTYLTLMKGGNPDAQNPDEKSIEVVSIPYSGGTGIAGREILFIPALLDILQTYVSDAITDGKAAVAGLPFYNRFIFKNRKKNIFISKDDIRPSVASASELTGSKVRIVSEEDVDAILLEGRTDALVSYVLAPVEPHRGAYCYKMLISADTHELFFYSRHRMSGAKGPGFLKKDIKWISR